MLAAVVIGIIVICISGVDSGPPDLSGPKIPRAELHEIYPEHGPVGHQIKITLSGKYFTEEYGVGVLRCKFKYSSGRSEPLEEVTLARRTTGGCIVTADPKPTPHKQYIATFLHCMGPESCLDLLPSTSFTVSSFVFVSSMN